MPSNASIYFTSSAFLSNGDQLPSDLITFDSKALEFTVSSADSTLVDSYDIKVVLMSNDSLWSGQTLETVFTLTATTPDETYTITEENEEATTTEENEEAVVNTVTELVFVGEAWEYDVTLISPPDSNITDYAVTLKESGNFTSYD